MKEQAWDFSDTWIEKLGRYWVHLLALFADLAAIVVISAAFLADHGRNLVTFYVLALLTTLWILLVIQEYRYARKASYAEAGRYLHTMLHFLRDTDAELATMPDATLAHNLERILGDVAKAFRS